MYHDSGDVPSQAKQSRSKMCTCAIQGLQVLQLSSKAITLFGDLREVLCSVDVIPKSEKWANGAGYAQYEGHVTTYPTRMGEGVKRPCSEFAQECPLIVLQRKARLAVHFFRPHCLSSLRIPNLS